MKYCICSITDNNFVIGLVTMLYSFLKHNKWYDGDIVIFYSEYIAPLSFFNQNKIQKMFINKSIKFYKIDESKYDIIMKMKMSRTAPSIFTFEAFELDYDRVVFLDADMIILKEIKPLFEINSVLGITYDNWLKYQNRPTLSKLIHKKEGYEEFNGGLLSIGRSFLKNGIRDKLIEHTKTRTSWPTWDQTILNSYFHGTMDSIYYFSSTYNSLKRCFSNRNFYKFDIYRPCIVHYVGKKPWNSDPKEHYKGRLENYSNINDIWKDTNNEINAENSFNSIKSNGMFLNQSELINESIIIKKYLEDPLPSKYMRVEELVHFSKTHDIFASLKSYIPEKIKIPSTERQTIAVVGNGDSILNKKHGRNIDSHNMVIRINDYSVDEKFVDDSGKKTDLIVLNEYRIIDYLQNGIKDDSIKYILLVNPREENYGLLILFYCYLHSINDKNKDKLLLLSPAYRRKICTVLNHQYPSSGYISVSFAKDLSPKHTSLYGFNIESNSSFYYQKLARINYTLHKIKNEYLLYKKWSSDNFIINAENSVIKPVSRSKSIPKSRPKISSNIAPKPVIKEKPKEIPQTIPKTIINSKPKKKPPPPPPQKIVPLPVKPIEGPEIKDIYNYAIYVYGTPYNISQNVRFLKLFLNNNKFDTFMHFNIPSGSGFNEDIKILQMELDPKSYLFEIHNKDHSHITKDWSLKLENRPDLSDIYSLYKCNELRMNYERENGKNYKYVISIKFNSTYFDIINNTIHNIILMIDKSYNNIFLPSYYNGFGVNTDFAIAPAKIMNIYANMYKWAETVKNRYLLDINYLMCKHIILNGIKINVMHLDYFHLKDRKFFPTTTETETIKNNMKQNWKQMGDIHAIDCDSFNTNTYYKIKTESIDNILKLKVDLKPKYLLYNTTFKKFLHINIENNMIYGSSCAGTILTITYAKENQTRICMSIGNNYLHFSDELELKKTMSNESELYVLKNGRHYSFQLVKRENNRNNKYGNHFGMNNDGIFSTDYDIEDESKFILMSEHEYRQQLRMMN